MMVPSIKTKDVIWELFSAKKLLFAVFNIIVSNVIFGLFRNIGIKLNAFIVGATIFCLLIYKWQGKYFESNDVMLAVSIAALISFGAPTIWETIFESLVRFAGFVGSIRLEKHDRLLAGKSVPIAPKTMSKILSATNTVCVEEKIDEDGEPVFLVSDASERLWRTLNVDMYSDLRAYLVTQDIFLSEKTSTPFGYEIRKTFRGLLHCEDGPAYFDYYREGNEMKFLKSEYYFLDNRYPSRDAWEAEMKDFYFKK